MRFCYAQVKIELLGERRTPATFHHASNLIELNSLGGHLSTTYGISFLPDGKTLESGSNDRTEKLWNVETGQEVGMLSENYGDATG
jgi:WD40 repeat protein